jgi:rSAM/selenodomain-associated transferase 2
MRKPPGHPPLITPGISVIVPTFNEARALGATLDLLATLPGLLEVIVVDGGSLDSTVAIARSHGVRVVSANRGRGIQLQAGAVAARGSTFWFVHADVHPPVDAARHIQDALARSGVSSGCFAVRFDSTSLPARFLTVFYAHLRRLGLCYGDATLFVRRTEYERAGGFHSFPLFEDVDLARRLRVQGRFVCLTVEVVASSRRFESRSFVLTFAWWMILQFLYWLGISPRLLGRMYAPVRGKPRRYDKRVSGRKTPHCGSARAGMPRLP